MTSSCGILRQFAIFAHRMWRNVLFQIIEHWLLGWPCSWARCWMLQEMDHMEASCVLYVKVGMFDQFEQRKFSVLTVTSLGIVMLTVHFDLIISVWFMYDPGNVLRQTSPDVLSFEEWPGYINETWDIRCHSSRCIPVNTQTTSDRLTKIARPLESSAAILSRIQLELHVQVGCHIFHFDL